MGVVRGFDGEGQVLVGVLGLWFVRGRVGREAVGWQDLGEAGFGGGESLEFFERGSREFAGLGARVVLVVAVVVVVVVVVVVGVVVVVVVVVVFAWGRVGLWRRRIGEVGL